MAAEWNRLARIRHAQISSGRDLSFDRMLTPLALELLEPCDRRVLLDVGCGTGDLTVRLASVSDAVIAIDPSDASIEVARSLGAPSHVEFKVGSLEGLLDVLVERRPTAAIAGMTLMTVPDLKAFAAALGRILRVGGRFAATMAHPWFWPRYWEYEDTEWFSYSEEIFVEAPFKTSTEDSGVATTHVHRPLEAYVGAFESEGFLLELVREPMPTDPTIEAVQGVWRFPRFLGLRWVRV